LQVSTTDLLASGVVQNEGVETSTCEWDQRERLDRGDHQQDRITASHKGNKAGDYGSLVGVPADVAPAEQPGPVPAIPKNLGDLAGRNQVARPHGSSRIGVLRLVEFRQFALIGLRLGLPLVGAEAVVEVVQHLRLVQREILLLVSAEDVAVEPPAVSVQM